MIDFELVVTVNTVLCSDCLASRLRSVEELKYLPFNLFQERTRDFRISFSKRFEPFKIYRCEDCRLFLYLNNKEGWIKNHDSSYIHSVADADINIYFSRK